MPGGLDSETEHQLVFLKFTFFLLEHYIKDFLKSVLAEFSFNISGDV